MKLPGLRRITYAAAPVALAAAMVGLTAAPANALPRRCQAIMDQVYTDWGLADIYQAEAEEANAAGDWLAWGYYNDLAAQYNAEADALYDRAKAMGC